MIDMQRKQTQL